MKPNETLETPRLLLRKPTPADAEAIFRRFSSDPEVTRYMSWPMHRTIADTLAFLAWSEDGWALWPAGSYLICDRNDPSRLLGSTGISFQTPAVAITGYVLAQDAWGFGFATEALRAMVKLARQLGVLRLEAGCHADHRRSAHVLEKCGFHLEELRRGHSIYPNLDPARQWDSFLYVRNLQNDTSAG